MLLICVQGLTGWKLDRVSELTVDGATRTLKTQGVKTDVCMYPVGGVGSIQQQ